MSITYSANITRFLRKDAESGDLRALQVIALAQEYIALERDDRPYLAGSFFARNGRAEDRWIKLI